MKITLLPIVCTLALISCTKEPKHQAYDKEVVREEMRNLVLSYGQAVELMDIEKTISHFNNDSEFYAFSDGRHYTYKEITESVRNEFFNGLKKIKLKWDTLNIKTIGENEAICFALLNQTLLDIEENIIKIQVEATFVGVKKENGWKIAYIHSRHKAIAN